jgi:hypothetical protein
VRVVAVEAPFAFLQRFVLETNILDVVAYVFMAIKTEFIP